MVVRREAGERNWEERRELEALYERLTADG